MFCYKNHRSSHWKFSVKEAVHKKLCQFQRKTPALECLFNEVAGLRACSFIKKRLQHRCFTAKLAKFLTSILTNICERLLINQSPCKKLFIDFIYKIMAFIIITTTSEALSFFCSVAQFLLIYFIEIFVPPFFVNFILLN